MCLVPAPSNPDEQCVYIPHHPVIRTDSATTHLRVVFNASSLTTNRSSLNDHLLCGEKLQNDPSAVITQWRRFKFVYIADIAKMYRQISLDQRDCNYQRILWNRSLNNAPWDYQLRTVTYGLTCAPFLALRVLKRLVADEGSSFPLAIPILRDSLYVDDVLFGDDDETHVRQIRHQVVSLLRRGHFELRKWASNSTDLLSDIDANDHGLACSKELGANEKVKLLGIKWNPSLDVFQIDVSPSAPASVSKKSILSTIAKLYDPLGWLTPITIAAKILMQALWREKSEWDDPVPSRLQSRWSLISSSFEVLRSITIPRWLGLGAEVLRAELHGFSEASTQAYAAVIYLRVITNAGTVSVSLIAGKSKVAPLTPFTVPRLELSAAVLLSRLFNFVNKSLQPKITSCFYWTDSSIVLAWLKHHPLRWKTFVANRVAEVQARLSTAEWRYVPTEDNPADCASRGLIGQELLDLSLWWQGPSWLLHSELHWPRSPSSVDAKPLPEKKAVAVHLANQQTNDDLSSRFFSWPKLIRITAYLFKFISRLRRTPCHSNPPAIKNRALSAAECNQSRQFWIKRIQSDLFPTEIRDLTQNRALSPKTPLSSLSPFLDENGLLRVGGRLRNAPIHYNRRHPILLASHPLVTLLIEQAHNRSLHAGLQLTLSVLRGEFWILRARSLVKAVIFKCVICARERAATPSQLMGDLPIARVKAPSRAFQHCGVDYAGPMRVRTSAGRGITARKAYITLFVCLATRAIHLELVSDYATPSFLNAFSRFCSRRGLPQDMYSDNGTTFVGADRELRSAYRAALHDPDFQNATASDDITWHFIPAAAPHFGGVWEAGVRSVKHHLRRDLKDHTLCYEEFTTLLYRVEACLNSRPIAPLTDTLDNYEPLTPGHFLIGSAITASPEPLLLDIKENHLTRWQLIRQLSERFWKLWAHDYINTLQQRNKWRRTQPPIKVGQFVLLRNPALPPCKWELGRVTRCHSGRDGLTRVVTIRTATAEYVRPIVKICVLPIEEEPETS